MDLDHGKHPLPSSLDLADYPEGYTDKWEDYLSIM